MDGHVSDPTSVPAPSDQPRPTAAVPEWVGQAVWRGIWQLIVAVLVTLPIAAIIQAFVSTYSRRYDVVESDLTQVDLPKPPRAGTVAE